MLAEERKQSQEVVKQSVAATREEMKDYLKEQRKVSVQFLINLTIKIPAKDVKQMTLITFFSISRYWAA